MRFHGEKIIIGLKVPYKDLSQCHLFVIIYFKLCTIYNSNSFIIST